MADRTVPPRTDPKFLDWSDNIDGFIYEKPDVYGLTTAQVTAFHDLYVAFQAAYERTIEPSTKTAVATAEKNAVRDALRVEARRVISIIDGQANVTEAQRVALGLSARRADPKPAERPKWAPLIELVSAMGNGVTIRLLDARDTNRRGKPESVMGATVFSHVGESAPTTENDWTYEGNTSKTTLTVQFPQTLPPGTKVWFTAIWYNRRAETGPPAAPVTCNLPGGAAMAKAA